MTAVLLGAIGSCTARYLFETLLGNDLCSPRVPSTQPASTLVYCDIPYLFPGGTRNTLNLHLPMNATRGALTILYIHGGGSSITK